MNNETKNPWLQIPVEDYEGHMSAPSVMQLQMLDEIFESVLNEFSPRSICVLGCTAGNGFQHLLNRDFDRVVGIDINREYVGECRNWFIQDVQNLQLVCADLNELELINPMFDLVHAALIFEYVDVDRLLSKISDWLRPNGTLSVVLQMPCETSSLVSETLFQSVKMLIPFIKLVGQEEFKKKAQKYGLEEIKSHEVKLESGKIFSVIIFKQNVGAQYIEPLQKENKLLKRRSVRLKEYDYSTPAYYYITICTHEHKYSFGKVNQQNIVLTNIGKIVNECWLQIPQHFTNSEVDSFIIMPNHIHGIIVINENKNITIGVHNFESMRKERDYQNIVPGSLGSIVRSFKAAVTRECRRKAITEFKWQRNYYEHVIRNEKELYQIRKYIEQNPLKWEIETMPENIDL